MCPRTFCTTLVLVYFKKYFDVCLNLHVTITHLTCIKAVCSQYDIQKCMFRRRDNIGFREDNVHTSLYSPYHTIPVYSLKINDIVSGEGLFLFSFFNFKAVLQLIWHTDLCFNPTHVIFRFTR